MAKPSHTHKTEGGRFGQVTTYWGSGPLEGQQLVVYQDLDRVTESLTTMEDWLKRWREIAPDDCTICLGTGTDQIKGNKRQPCGGCYGLGKVKADGETPSSEWELADVATAIIKRQQQELEQRRATMALPKVAAAIKAHREAQGKDWADREQQWRDGRGRGPGGRRYTGD